jgi:very-short-patch-repair endonuclease
VLGVRELLPVSGPAVGRVAAIAALQRGRVARWQLLDAGIAPRVISGLIERGVLHPEHYGVYAVVHTAPVPLARETAALLACGDRAILSHGSAATLWGLVPQADGPVDVTLADGKARRQRPGLNVHRSRGLLKRDVRIHEGLSVTSPAWTLLDLAAFLDSRSLQRALDEALVVKKIVSRTEIEHLLARSRGRAGAAALRALMARRRFAITHSKAERRCLELIREAGLPEPRTQVRIGAYTVDLLWPEHRVVFEIDGYRFHTSRFAFDRDRRKDTALKAAAYDPNRVSRDQVLFEPFAVIAAIAAALARATVAGRGTN